MSLLNIPVNAPGTEPPPPIQTKLTIGQPGDKYEQEADQVASQVVQQINSPVSESGQDLFFRGGEYNPGSRGGQELIAHELTHVVQQTGAIQRGQNQQKLTSLVQENVISPRIQCWFLPTDWLDYIGLTIDVAERIYIELGYKEGQEKDFKRFVNNLFIAIDLIFATAPGAGGGGLALRASHSGAVVVWAATPDSLKLKIAAEVAKRMGWPVTKALQMANIYFSTSNKEEGERRDLESHENEGGHTEERHVGKS